MLVVDQDRIDAVLNWPALIDGLDAAHRLGRGRTHDLLLEEGSAMILNRTAWKPGYGLGVKTVTGFWDNPKRSPPQPSVQGVYVLFDHQDGRPLAVIDGAAITGWKTAADSALGSRYLSRPDAACFLMVGAGAMARPLIQAHRCVRPGIERVLLWNRTPLRSQALADALVALGIVVETTTNLADAVGRADIISCATRSEEPLIHGAWLRPGSHLDLVGAFTPAMREADDAVLQRAQLFVDARESTIEHTGELAIPIARGVITADDVVADLYDLAAGFAWQRTPDAITVYKNGGGAHLDLMTAVAVYEGVVKAGTATAGPERPS